MHYAYTRLIPKLPKKPKPKMSEFNERTTLMIDNLEKLFKGLEVEPSNPEVFPLDDDLIQVTIEKTLTPDEIRKVKNTILNSLVGYVVENEEVEIKETSIVTISIKPKEPAN